MNRRDTVRRVYHQRSSISEFDATKPRTAMELQRDLQSYMHSMHSAVPALLSFLDNGGMPFLHATHQTWCSSCETPLSETINWLKMRPVIELDAELLSSCHGDVFRALDTRLHVPERADTHADRVCRSCKVQGQFVRRSTTDIERHVGAPRLIMVDLPDLPPQHLGGTYDVRAGESVSTAQVHVACTLTTCGHGFLRRFLRAAASSIDRRPTRGKIQGHGCAHDCSRPSFLRRRP